MFVDACEIRDMIAMYEAMLVPLRLIEAVAEEELAELRDAFREAMSTGDRSLALQVRGQWYDRKAQLEQDRTRWAAELDELDRLKRQLTRLAA